MKNELSKEEMFDAIRIGVKEAFHEMMESGDGINGMIRTEEVMDAIREGVTTAFNVVNIESAIKNGVIDSMPYGSEILSAIYNGTEEAIKGR